MYCTTVRLTDDPYSHICTYKHAVYTFVNFKVELLIFKVKVHYYLHIHVYLYI